MKEGVNLNPFETPCVCSCHVLLMATEGVADVAVGASKAGKYDITLSTLLIYTVPVFTRHYLQLSTELTCNYYY